VSSLRLAFDMTPAHVSPAGVGRYARGMARALERHPDVELHAVEAGAGEAGGTPGRLARGLKREGLYYPWLLQRRARAERAQVLHVPAPYGPRTGGLPLVLSAHDVLPLSHPELFTRTMTAHMRHVSARHLLKAERVLCGSEHVRGELVELVGVPVERIAVTPYGVDERFRPVEREPEWLRERFGVDGHYLLCVGTLEPRKNLARAVQAFAQVAREEDGLALVIVGAPGWRNEAFERELGAAGARVVVAGRVPEDELVRLYSGAACLLFPSLGEGVGFPVLEAMACGAPVVASDRTSLPELVGDAGLLVDPTDTEAIAAAALEVLRDSDLCARLRERGLARTAAHSWDACAAATVPAYRAALEERS
jgi:glycosyltransferase involved in cell wall biosynthesis